MSGMINTRGSKSGILGIQTVSADFSGTNYTAASYGDNIIWKIDEVVHFSIVCSRSGTPANNEIVCFFPIGYAPVKHTSYPGTSSTGYQGDDIDVLYLIAEDGTGDSSNPRALKIGSPNNLSSSTFHLRLNGHFHRWLVGS